MPRVSWRLPLIVNQELPSEFPPHFRITRPPCLPAPPKTPVVWRLAGRRHRLTHRTAGKPPLPRDALIEFEFRHRLCKRVGVAR